MLAPYQQWPVFGRFFFSIAFVFAAMIFFGMEQSSGMTYLVLPVFVSWILFYWSRGAWRPVFYFLPFFALLFYAFGFICSMVYLGFAVFFVLWWQTPFPRYVQYGVLLIVVTFMALERVSYFGMARMGLMIPYIAAVFMFRLAIYLNEKKHQRTNEPLWMQAAYFLQPANLVFLLYPIVDYRRYVNSAKEDYVVTLRVARERLYRSLFHFLLYRLIYFYVAIGYTDVHDFLTLLQFAIAAYMLILQISAMYYFAVGVMGLFGFNLPDPFRFYFLPSGFTQLWTRINVYWREFIVQVFFYPFYFRIRKRWPRNAIWVSTICCFFVSWLLHSYQLFWISGHIDIKLTGLVYWMTIGTGVTIGIYLLERKKINPFRIADHLYFSAAVLLALRVLCMFLFMSFLWILWQCNSVGEWFFLLQKLQYITPLQILYLLLAIVCIVVLGALLWLGYEKRYKRYLLGNNYVYWVFPVIVLAMVWVYAEQKGYVTTNLSLAWSNVRNQADQQNHEQGYYDQLIAGKEGNLLPWETRLAAPLDWSQGKATSRPTDNVLMRELKPSVSVVHHGSLVRTNSLGMRDQEYAVKKGPGTIRFILTGGSYEAGAGVENNEIYETLAEDTINRLLTARHAPKHIEILNLAMGGYYLPQCLWLAENKISVFGPDYFIYAAHSQEADRMASNMARMITLGTDLHYPFLIEIKTLSGAHQRMGHNEIKNRLYPYTMRLLNEGYEALAKACLSRGVKPVWLYVPVLGHPYNPAEVESLKALARSKGFIVLDLSQTFKGLSDREFMLSEADNHPNAAGHRLLGHAFANELLQKLINSGQ